MNYTLIESLKTDENHNNSVSCLFEQVAEWYSGVTKEQLTEAASHLLARLIDQIRQDTKLIFNTDNGQESVYSDDMWEVFTGIVLIGDPDTTYTVREEIAQSKPNPDKFLRTVLSKAGKTGSGDDRANLALRNIAKRVNPQAVDNLKHKIVNASTNDKDKKELLQYLGLANQAIMRNYPQESNQNNQEIPPIQRKLNLK